MSDRNWRHVAVFGVVLASAIALAGAFSSFNAYRSDNRRAYDDDAARNATEARQVAIVKCGELSGAALTLCLDNAVGANAETRQPDYDLKAQQEMAEWAFAMWWTALFGAVVTTVGVIYVARTLDQTRKATDAAVDANKGFIKASQQQLTAYVLGENPQILQTFNKANHAIYKLQFNIKLKNTGQTPAFEMSNICNSGWVDEAGFARMSLEALPSSRMVLGPGSEVFARNVLKESTGKEAVFTNEAVETLIARGATFWLKGCLRYRDIEGRLWQHDYSWRLLDPKALLAAPEAEDGKWKRREFGLYANAAGNDLRVIEDVPEKN